MAETTEKEKAPSSSENLTCPLCLNIFDEATILTSCGHTFCRKCLKNYDLSHQDLDHMICPLCRKNTQLSANRVDDFPTNVTVNGLVDNYHAKCGGTNAALEMPPKCTACKFHQDAVSFCRTCNNYMCTNCDCSHKQLTSFFEGHEIVPLQDIIDGKVTIGHLPEKCSIHKQESKVMFCGDCKVHACHKCVIVGHKNHNIKNQADFEQELRLTVNDLVQRGTAMKTELEKNIQNVELQRHEVYTAVQKLLDDVNQAYSIKAKELEKNHKNLIEQINVVNRSFGGDLNVLKSKDLLRIKSICSSITLLSNDRLDRFDTDSLSAHTLLCEELDAMLKEAIDHTSAAAVTKKAQEKRFMPACDTFLELGSILQSDPKLQVIQCVDLRGYMSGMTPYSDDSVAIGYSDGYGIDIIDSAGKQEQYANMPSDMTCLDLVFQQDRTLCIARINTEAHIYSPNGSKKLHFHMQGFGFLKLNRSPSDEILIANGQNKCNIFDPTGYVPIHTVPTKHNKTQQVSATRSGLIVTTSCCSYNDPSVVTVYDRKGKAGESLQAPDSVDMYAAVDAQDKVYIASVHRNGVLIRLYDIDGLNLVERVEFNVLNLEIYGNWCYLVSLSSDMLAFACHKKLYFIEVSQ